MNKTKIRRVVRAIAPEVKVTFRRGDTFYLSHDFNKINVDLDDLEDDGGFTRHLLNKHLVPLELCLRYTTATCSILHELGHYFCDDDIEETHEDKLTRVLCSMIPRETATEEQQDLYFDLPFEWEATEWAICFVVEHQELVDYLDDLLWD